jgi:ABC-2 type transport system permease protein
MSFMGARISSQLVVALVQAAILLGLAKLVFGVTFVGGPLSLAVFVLLGSLAFLAVASVSRKQESAVAPANLVSFPMLFLSGIFFPLDQSPVWLQDLARVLPLSYLADGLRQIVVYGVWLARLWLDAGALTLTIALAVRFFQWEPKTS